MDGRTDGHDRPICFCINVKMQKRIKNGSWIIGPNGRNEIWSSLNPPMTGIFFWPEAILAKNKFAILIICHTWAYLLFAIPEKNWRTTIWIFPEIYLLLKLFVRVNPREKKRPLGRLPRRWRVVTENKRLRGNSNSFVRHMVSFQ